MPRPTYLPAPMTPFATLCPAARDLAHQILARLRESTAPVSSLDLLELGKGELDAIVQALVWLASAELVRYESPRGWVLVVARENMEAASEREGV